MGNEKANEKAAVANGVAIAAIAHLSRHGRADELVQAVLDCVLQADDGEGSEYAKDMLAYINEVLSGPVPLYASPLPAPFSLLDGKPSTLGNWRAIAQRLFGADSFALNFLDERIRQSGADKVLADNEPAILHSIARIHMEPWTRGGRR